MTSRVSPAWRILFAERAIGAAVTIAVGAAGSLASSQTTAPEKPTVEPIVEQASKVVDVAQVRADGDRHIDAPQVGPTRAAAPPVQLTTERGTTSAGDQIFKGSRSAQAPAALSQPAEGRTGAVTAIIGSDRCGPSEKRTRPAVCDHVIETRGAEFVRPALQLSPEQQLLVDQRLRAGLSMSPTELGRTGARDADPNDLRAQVIASTAAGSTPTADQEPLPAPLPDVPATLLQALASPGGR